jgi:hypothetical protein
VCQKITLILIPVVLVSLVSCASRPSSKKDDVTAKQTHRPRNLLLDARADVRPPDWIERPPQFPGYHVFIGEAQGAKKKEDALEKAWVSAFLRAGMTEFPELAILSSQSSENLKSSTYERDFVMQLERVNWRGIREVTDYGSPFVNWDSETGTYTVFRLLRWADSDMESARAELKLNRMHEMPASPESVRMDEERMVKAVRAVQAVNAKVDRRNALLEKVFHEMKCGVTLSDLVKILGPPERSNPYNGLVVEKEYSWGQYTVGRAADDPTIAVVTRQDSSTDRRVVCPGRLQND